LEKIQQNAELMNKTKQEVLDEIDKKGEFFDKVGFSVLKTMAMFLGEVEFSDIPFNNIPYFSHVSFVIFVFFIVIVLMNLLTGLAVDETSEIQKNAEVSSQVIRVKVIWQMEKACPLLWSRCKKVGEDNTLVKVKVNEPLCKCKVWFVCTCGSQDSWRKELLTAVKKRREEQKMKEDQENVIRKVMREEQARQTKK